MYAGLRTVFFRKITLFWNTWKCCSKISNFLSGFPSKWEMQDTLFLQVCERLWELEGLFTWTEKPVVLDNLCHQESKVTKSPISRPPEEPYVIMKSSVVSSDLGSEKKKCGYWELHLQYVHLRAGEKTLDKLQPLGPMAYCTPSRTAFYILSVLWLLRMTREEEPF